MAQWDRNKPPMVRLKAREWTHEEDRASLFRDVMGRSDLKLKEILWTLTAPEAEIRQLGAMLLPRFNEPALAQILLEELKDKNPAQQRLLLRHLVRCEPAEVLQVAQKLLQDPDKTRKALSLELVGALPVGIALSLMPPLLTSPLLEARLSGLQKLQESPSALDDKSLRELLSGLLSDPEERVRQACYKAIIGTHHRDTALNAMLVNGLKDSSFNVHSVCSQALSARTRLNDPGLEQLLIPLLFDASPIVRESTLTVLLQSPSRARIMQAYLKHSTHATHTERAHSHECLAAYKDDICESLNEVLLLPDDAMQVQALLLAEAVADARLLPSLLKTLKSPVPKLRLLTIELLARLGDSRATPALCELLQDERLIPATLHALSRIKDPHCVVMLTPLATHAKVQVRSALLEALLTIGDNTFSTDALILMAQKDPDPAIQMRAHEGLRRLKVAAPMAEKSLQSPSQVEGSAPLSSSPFYSLLQQARQHGCSALLLVAGQSPWVRHHGRLQKLDGEIIASDPLLDLLNLLTPPPLRERVRRGTSIQFARTFPDLGRCRVHVASAHSALSVQLYFIEAEPIPFGQIGLPRDASALLAREQGLIIVSSEACGGRSTTLASMVQHLSRQRARHIMTYEDVIEYALTSHLSLVTQRETGVHIVSLQSALAPLLDQSVEVLACDAKGPPAALEQLIIFAGLGRLVLLTMQASSVSHVLEQLMSRAAQMPPSVRLLLSESLLGIVHQSLAGTDSTRRSARFETLIPSQTQRAHIRKSGGDLGATASPAGSHHD